MPDLPSNITDCIDYAGMALEKGALVLGKLTTDYCFDERPLMTAYSKLTLI